MHTHIDKHRILGEKGSPLEACLAAGVNDPLLVQQAGYIYLAGIDHIGVILCGVQTQYSIIKNFQLMLAEMKNEDGDLFF